MISVYLQGFGISAGLIAAVGAQNAYVLGQGLKRQHHGVAMLVCILCDSIFIVAGVAGLGTLISKEDTALAIAQYGGAAFLIAYGIMAARRAMKPGASLAAATRGGSTRKAVIMTTLAVTLLNPHFYLDTVVLLGAIGGQFTDDARPWFAAGAVTASFVWFGCITFGAAWAAPYVAKPGTWRVIDAVTACVMTFMAVMLVLA